MKSHSKINISEIENSILKISNIVKEIAVFIHNDQLFALIYPNFDVAKKRHIVRLENELKWYAVELYNINAPKDQKIKGYQIVQVPLPRDNKGEVKRNELDQFMKANTSLSYDNEDEPMDEVYQSIKKFLSDLTDAPIRPTSHLELDLHLDSLNYIETLSFIEKSFDVHIDEKQFSQMLIMGELCNYVNKKKEKFAFADINWNTILNEKISFDLKYTSVPIMIYKTLFLPLYKLYFSLKVSGYENLPSQPCIIAPSHQSMLDGFILAAALPYNILKKTFFLAFQIVFGTKTMRLIMRHTQTIMIDENNDLKASMQKSTVPLKNGQNLVLFPEGARSRDRELLEFKRFFAILSIELDIPVVPVVIDGTFESMPAGKLFPRPSPVIIKYLDPIYPKGLNYDELTNKVKKAIHEEMIKHPLLDKIEIMNFLELFTKPALIAAHRGDRSCEPENTLSAINSSIGKCDFIEIDVQLTKDLVPVIIHDETLTRTSNVSKVKRFAGRSPWKVSNFTLEELQSLDFGSWFNQKFEPVLMLEKALTFAKDKKLFLNVEIKDMSNSFSNETVVQIVIEMIKKTQTEHLVLLSSFNHNYLPMCKKLSQKIPTAALQMYKNPDNLIDYLKTLKVDAYHPDNKIINKKIVSDLRESGFFINVFTINNVERKEELFEWGVNGIFTDILTQ